ncbi:hypothetical protein PO124_27590 [Bacillus licheniformis]|nr:hypothetical protein [Bacillus licheniformis]
MKHGKSPLFPQWPSNGAHGAGSGVLKGHCRISGRNNRASDQNPAIIVIGDIVSFRQNSWFEESL